MVPRIWSAPLPELRQVGRSRSTAYPRAVPAGSGPSLGDVDGILSWLQDPGRDGLRVPYQGSHNRILGPACSEVRGPVQRIDQPGRRCLPQRRQEPGVDGSGFFSDDRRLYHGTEALTDQLLGVAVGDGDDLTAACGGDG